MELRKNQISHQKVTVMLLPALRLISTDLVKFLVKASQHTTEVQRNFLVQNELCDFADELEIWCLTRSRYFQHIIALGLDAFGVEEAVLCSVVGLEAEPGVSEVGVVFFLAEEAFEFVLPGGGLLVVM
jgi:hypothetical protein